VVALSPARYREKKHADRGEGRGGKKRRDSKDVLGKSARYRTLFLQKKRRGERENDGVAQRVSVARSREIIKNVRADEGKSSLYLLGEIDTSLAPKAQKRPHKMEWKRKGTERGRNREEKSSLSLDMDVPSDPVLRSCLPVRRDRNIWWPG